MDGAVLAWASVGVVVAVLIGAVTLARRKRVHRLRDATPRDRYLGNAAYLRYAGYGVARKGVRAGRAPDHGAGRVWAPGEVKDRRTWWARNALNNSAWRSTC